MIEGYWFAQSDYLPNGDGRQVVIGEMLRVDPPLTLCRSGLHASRHPFDALQYARGPLLYKVRLSGEIIEDDDKLCATERTALAVVDLTPYLREFARKQALSVSHLWNAPEVVKEYLETGREDIRGAARAAAWAAAEAAARAAAEATARAAAEATAWAAAREMFKQIVDRAFEASQ